MNDADADADARSAGADWLEGMDDDEEVFPDITAGDLRFVLTPRPLDGLRQGTVRVPPKGRHRLHWYAPADEGPHPAVLFVHSGSWSAGDATMYLRHASDLARRGYVTASTDYALAPAARWPEPLIDVCLAVRWLRDDPLDLGVDATRVAVAGGSAGGHLAAMAALAPVVGSLDPGDVSAAVLWYPPLRLATAARIPELAAPLTALLGSLTTDSLEAASPLNHTSALAPPILTMTGDLDPLVPLDEARSFHRALSDVGVPNNLIVVEGGRHGFDLTRRWYDQSLQWTERFLAESLARVP